MSALRATSLTRRVASLTIVEGVDLELEPGVALALLGPSGSGKSTLLHMAGLLERPTAGAVYVAGATRDAWTLSAAERAALRLASIGFVFQQHFLLPRHSARENVALPAWRLSGSRKRALERADELLARMGLDARADTTSALLSMGEAQRVAIARALANRPRVVLADEPTGSLDAGAKQLALDTLLSARADGAALLLVTHDADVAGRADRILQLRGGRLVVAEDADS